MTFNYPDKNETRLVKKCQHFEKPIWQVRTNLHDWFEPASEAALHRLGDLTPTSTKSYYWTGKYEIWNWFVAVSYEYDHIIWPKMMLWCHINGRRGNIAVLGPYWETTGRCGVNWSVKKQWFQLDLG